MRISIAAVAFLLALTGCATVVGPVQSVRVGKTTVTAEGLEGYNRLAVTPADPNNPNIFVPGNAIVIDQEPLRPLAAGRYVTIIWRLDADHGSPYSFPDDSAITLYPGADNPLPDELNCGTVGASKKVFICHYARPASPKKWKYRVKLKNSSGTDPEALDPWIHQS